MLKATVFQMRYYLQICGLTHNATQGAFEQWVGTYKGKDVCVFLCVSEQSIPDFSIDSIINEIGDTKEKFRGIISLIR